MPNHHAQIKQKPVIPKPNSKQPPSQQQQEPTEAPEINHREHNVSVDVLIN